MPSRTARGLATLLLCLHLALGCAHNFLVGPDDDRLWLYASGAELGQSARMAELNARVHDSLNTLARPQSQAFRFSLREGYHRNYVAAAMVYGAAAGITGGRLGELRLTDYPAYLARTMYVAFVAMYVVTSLVLVLVVLLAADRTWLASAVLAVGAIALMESVFDLTGDTWSGLPTLLPDAQTRETFWQNLWPNLPALFVNPQIQLSPFGDTPRNHFILLMLPLFLLRWRGWFTGSYVFLAALGFLHQSHTGLVLACLVAVDAVLRPSLFRGRALPVVALVLAIFLGRESLGGVIGVTRPAVLALVAVTALLVCAFVYWGLRGRMGWAAIRLARVRERLLRRGVVFADLALLGIILLVSFPVAAAVNAMGTEVQSLYFWTQVHGRSLGIFRPALMLGLAFLAVSRLEERFGAARAWAFSLGFAAAALVPSLIEAAMHDRQPVARIERQARTLETAVGPSVDWAGIGHRSEPEIYYAIARTLDTGR
jgi:hypothetical protein